MLELRIPPLLLVVLFSIAMTLCALATPSLRFVLPGSYFIAVVLALAGTVASAAGVVAFRRNGTTVNPLSPDSSSTVVRSGIYGFSRNPMYLGFLLWLCSFAAYLASWVALLFLPAFVAYMSHYQIRQEERALLAKFGEPFAQYMASVRRWV